MIQGQSKKNAKKQRKSENQTLTLNIGGSRQKNLNELSTFLFVSTFPLHTEVHSHVLSKRDTEVVFLWTFSDNLTI